MDVDKLLDLNMDLSTKVGDLVNDEGEWNRDCLMTFLPPHIIEEILAIHPLTSTVAKIFVFGKNPWMVIFLSTRRTRI